VTTAAVMLALRHAGWSLGEWVTNAGHVAEAHSGGHRIVVTARSSRVAWLALWAKLTGPRRAVASGPAGG
jgi:hypothetical protein